MTDNDITCEIRGAVYDVYKALGPGLLESVYEEALVFELEQRGLKVERQKQVSRKNLKFHKYYEDWLHEEAEYVKKNY